MSFDPARDIPLICTGVATIIGAIGTFIYKCRGKSFRDVMNDLFFRQSKDVQELSEVVKTQATVIKDVIDKAINKPDSKQDNKKEKE